MFFGAPSSDIIMKLVIPLYAWANRLEYLFLSHLWPIMIIRDQIHNWIVSVTIYAHMSTVSNCAVLYVLLWNCVGIAMNAIILIFMVDKNLPGIGVHL